MVILIKTLLISSILKTTKVVCGHHISRIVRPYMVDSENHKYSERVYVVKLLNTKFIWLATQRLSQRVLLLLQVSSSEKGSIVTYQGSKLTSSVNQLSNLTWLYNYIRYEIQNSVIFVSKWYYSIENYNLYVYGNIFLYRNPINPMNMTVKGFEISTYLQNDLHNSPCQCALWWRSFCHIM